MINRTLVSVIIPTYNRGHIIQKSIDSVLKQTYQNFEIIVVDDGSTDNTESLIKNLQDHRIKYYKHKLNQGQSSARNTGIKNSLGELIAFIDSDVSWNETKLEKQIKLLMHSSKDTAVIHCGVEFIDYKTGEKVRSWIVKDDINKNIFKNIDLGPDTPTMLIKKEALLDVGFFDEEILAHEETELAIRLAIKYKFRLLDEYLIYSLKNHEQITSKPASFYLAKEKIYLKHNKILDKKLCYKLCKNISGFNIVYGDLVKAKKYLRLAIKYKFFEVYTLLTYLLLNLFPSYMQSLYQKNINK